MSSIQSSIIVASVFFTQLMFEPRHGIILLKRMTSKKAVQNFVRLAIYSSLISLFAINDFFYRMLKHTVGEKTVFILWDLTYWLGDLSSLAHTYHPLEVIYFEKLQKFYCNFVKSIQSS